MTLLLFFLISCQSYRTIGIETYNPSVVTFPPEITTVMIVNNAAQQPDDFGHVFYNLIKPDTTTSFSLSVDSMAYLFCMALGKEMSESPIFDDVRLCEDTLRFDSLFYISKPLTLKEFEALCDEYDVDAIISLDKLYFTSTLQLSSSVLRSQSDFLKVNVFGEMRAFCMGKQVATLFNFMDSISWTPFDLGLFLYEKEEITSDDIVHVMRYLSEETGRKMHGYFVPFWSEAERWYYTHFTSEWKRASVYAAAGKWQEAANEWQALYDRTKNGKQKAFLASNLALYHEVTGDFSKAIAYAEIADAFFTKNSPEDDNIRIMQREYLELLKKRLEDNKTLTKQLREGN